MGAAGTRWPTRRTSPGPSRWPVRGRARPYERPGGDRITRPVVTARIEIGEPPPAIPAIPAGAPGPAGGGGPRGDRGHSRSPPAADPGGAEVIERLSGNQARGSRAPP